MIKKLFMIILCTLFLTGCWDRRELNELGIVLATGLDKGSAGELVLTSQVVRPAAIRKQGGGGGQESPIEIITARGSTVFEAIKNISKEFDKNVTFSHNKVLLIDEQLARDGLLPILDFLARSYEIRGTCWMIIAKDSMASKILGEKHGMNNTQAIYMNDIIVNKKQNSEVSAINILDMLKAVGGNEINPICGVMEIIQEKTKEVTHKGVKLTGTAVFKKDKLVGFLSDIETRGLNWVTGEVKGGVINVPSPTIKNKLIAIEIKRSSVSVKPKIEDETISFVIEVKEEGAIVEEQTLTDVSKLPVLEEIENSQKMVIEKEIKRTVDKVQKEYGSDNFGFGKALNDKYPDKWKEVKDRWEDMFPEVKYTVEVDAKIRNTGLLQKSVIEEKQGPEPE